MRVLEQGDEIKRGSESFFTASNGIELSTVKCPELRENEIYVRGETLDEDNNGDVYHYNTPEEAALAIQRYVQAIGEYNQSLVATEANNNYYVMPEAVFSVIKFAVDIPYYVGVFVPTDDGRGLKSVKRAQRHNRDKSVSEMLRMMFRSANRDRRR